MKSLRLGIGLDRVGVVSAPSSLLTNLVASWKLSDANDSHTNALHLTEVNSPTYVAGQVGNAVSLVRASSQYLSRASESSLQFGAGALTIGCWVKLSSTGIFHMLVTKDTGSGASVNREYALYVDNSNNLSFVVFDAASSISAVVGTALSSGAWYWFCGWYDPATLRCYASVNNGTAAQSASTLTPNTGGTAPFNIGARNDGNNPTNGLIDEVSIWKGAAPLTAQQRTDLYAAQLAGGGSYPFTGIA